MTQPVIAPRLTPPAPDSGGSSGLPDDILTEQARRLVLFSGVSAFMWTCGLTMDGLILPATIGFQPARSALVLEAVSAAATIAVFLFVRFKHLHTHTKCRAGIWLMLLNAFLITLLEIYNSHMVAYTVGRPSWTAILILASAMIMPSTPRRTLIASLVAAAMGPIGMGIAHLAGVTVPPLGTNLVLYLPDFICAVVATLPSAMFQKMGRQLKQARARPRISPAPGRMRTPARGGRRGGLTCRPHSTRADAE